MTRTDMEDRLENLDLRLSRIEQVLPTLATKDDLNAFATKDDLKAFATKDDLKAFATKEDMAQLESRQRAFTESAFTRMNMLFDGLNTRLANVEVDTKGIQYSLDRLVQRLEAKNVI